MDVGTEPRPKKKSVWRSLKKGLGLKRKSSKKSKIPDLRSSASLPVETTKYSESRVSSDADVINQKVVDQQTSLALAKFGDSSTVPKSELKSIPEGTVRESSRTSIERHMRKMMDPEEEITMEDRTELVRQLTSPSIGLNDWLKTAATDRKIHDTQLWPRKSHQFSRGLPFSISNPQGTVVIQTDGEDVPAVQSEDSKRIMALEFELKAFKLTVEEQRAEIAELRSNRDELSKIAEDAMNRLEVSGEENEELQKALSEKDSLITELQTLQRKQSEEINRFRTSLEDATQSRDEAAKKYKEISSQTDKLKKALSEQNEEMFEKLADASKKLHTGERVKRLEEAILVLREKLAIATQATKISKVPRLELKSGGRSPFKGRSAGPFTPPYKKTPSDTASAERRNRSVSGIVSYSTNHSTFASQIAQLEKSKHGKR